MLAIESLSAVLVEELDIDIAIVEVENYLAQTNDFSKYVPVLRTLESYKNGNILDFCGHFRQCMNYFSCSFYISEILYHKIFEYKNLFGFIFNHGQKYSVNINKTMLSEIVDLKSTYTFENRRVQMSSIGDGRLYRYYEYSSYTSLSQKMLMYFISNMQKKETLLVCLPTGGGKSMSWQLPAIANSYQGLIIVVVPTVALAIDHERTSKIAYDNVFGVESYPLAYYSGVDRRKRQQIYDEIEAGTLPILYISPEALLNKELQNRIYSAAENGKVSALIIDEAHLIVSWGIRFRPEFQFLSSFRNKLQNISTDGIKTILLSATLTSEDTEIIKNIFQDEFFTEYRADELRPEPSYYAHHCNSEDERIELIKRIVSLAPKPLIVYTVSPEQGQRYYDVIKDMGYHNVALFTGQTKNSDRENIIYRWSDNKIDIMVATSAFGMGVDKPDVRTVVTAYIPDTVSRFYQEVGRAGRDGFAALNYLLTFSETDNEFVRSLTKGSVLTIESLVNRWLQLLSDSTRESPNTLWLDVNVPPEHLRFNPTGRRNAGWNKDVILFLYRAGLIEIMDINNVSYQDYKILVLLKNIRVLENENLLEKYISDLRDIERARINNGIENVKRLLKSEKKGCYSNYLINEFPYSAELCNGCPYCRKHSLENFSEDAKIVVNSNKKALVETQIAIATNSFLSFLMTSRSIMLSMKEVYNGRMICKCIDFLIKNKVNVVIGSDNYDKIELIQLLSYYENDKYVILTLNEALKFDMKWLNGICALIYTEDEIYNNQLYSFSVDYLNDQDENKVVHIALSNQYIECEMKNLSEITDQNLIIEQYVLGSVIQ